MEHSEKEEKVNTKVQIRKQIASKRNALDNQWLQSSSARIVESLISMEAFQSSDRVALYMAISGEVNLNTLFSTCWKIGKRTCIPIFNYDSKLYDMAEITSETRFKTGHYGIQEPSSPSLIPSDWSNLFIVPGVAFDIRGSRLGRGGGYYDRLLEHYSGKTIAVAFEFQVYQQIPTEFHDKPVDFIVTETKTVEV